MSTLSCQTNDTQKALSKIKLLRGEASDRTPLALPSVSRYFPPAVAKVYIVSFRSHNDDRSSKFIVMTNNRKQAIGMAWDHGGPDFWARFDKSTGQAASVVPDRPESRTEIPSACKSFAPNSIIEPAAPLLSSLGLVRWICRTAIGSQK